MPVIKDHFKLNVMGIFNVGQWDHYPTNQEIAAELGRRFGEKDFLDGNRITFQVVKHQFIDPDELQVGDVVEVVEPFYWYEDDQYKVGHRFTIGEEHIKHGFEKFVRRV